MISHLFASTTKRAQKLAGHASDYIKGLLSELPRKNMERMGEAMRGVKHEDLQHFISGSGWDHLPVFTWIAKRVSQRLGGHRDSMLSIDESCFAKKGDESVGVARQYNGRLGKTENSQVGVFAGLGCGKRIALIGARLLLPNDWINDRDRCKRAGVPDEHIKERTKIDLARELIEEAIANGVQFDNVGIDSFYGRDQKLLCWIEDLGKVFVADVPSDLLVWDECPEGKIGPGERARSGAHSVSAWSDAHCKKGSGKRITLRVGENGPVVVEVWRKRVWLMPTGQKEPRQWWLIARRDRNGKIKYTLCNAPANTSLERLAKLQGQRYFIERVFQDAKSHAGMAQYQSRGWVAWHHHMVMVAMAMVFVMEEKVLLERDAPMLSAHDVAEILDWHMREHPRVDEVIARVRKRHAHRARQQELAIKRAAKKRR